MLTKLEDVCRQQKADKAGENGERYRKLLYLFDDADGAITKIPSVASKRGHETKKRVLKECQTCRVLPPIIKSSTAFKTNCPTKGKRIV